MNTPQTKINAIDTCFINKSVDEVWSVLIDIRRYPEWWPRWLAVRVLVIADTSTPIGTQLQIRPMGGRAFRCVVDSIDSPNEIVMRYAGSFVTGTGKWSLLQKDRGCEVSYELDVVAEGRLVALAARLMNLPKFHSQSMKGVFQALKERV